MSIAPLAGGPGGSRSDETPLDIATLQVDDAAAAFEPMDLLAGAGAHGGGYGKRRAWGINALRETPRLPRHAVLKAARPFGFPGGTRVTLRIAQEDGSIGQGDRPLPAGGDDGRRSADRRERLPPLRRR